MSVAPIGRKEEGRLRLRLFQEKGDGGLADHAGLRAGLGIGKTDRSLFLVKPRVFEAQPFHAAETRQQKKADRRQTCRMLPLFRGEAQGLAETVDFGVAEPPFARRTGEPSDNPWRDWFQ